MTRYEDFKSKDCAACGARMKRPKGTTSKKWAKVKTCSYTCMGALKRKPMEPKPCEYCGKRMDPPEYITLAAWTQKRYCSHKCSADAKGERVRAEKHEERSQQIKTCLQCGETFSRADLSSPTNNEAWEVRKFCKRGCRDEYQRRENHPYFKGDDAQRHTGRLRARKWYPRQPCEVCGLDAGGKHGVHRHHKDGNTLNNDPSNIQFLCRKHHDEVHSQERSEMMTQRHADSRVASSVT